MHPIYNYDIYIFDCDGVILDSNQLKIDAMKTVLCALFKDRTKIENCVNYFKNNFGKSRFHHVDVFLADYFIVADQYREEIREKILNAYSSMCKKLYLDADLTPGFIEFISSLKGKKFVASGSEQEELREVFKQRGLDVYFDEVFGSPTVKTDLITHILHMTDYSNAIMFGDAISDFDAALKNSIEFIAYIPFSNVQEELTNLSIGNEFKIIDSWTELNSIY